MVFCYTLPSLRYQHDLFHISRNRTTESFRQNRNLASVLNQVVSYSSLSKSFTPFSRKAFRAEIFFSKSIFLPPILHSCSSMSSSSYHSLNNSNSKMVFTSHRKHDELSISPECDSPLPNISDSIDGPNFLPNRSQSQSKPIHVDDAEGEFSHFESHGSEEVAYGMYSPLKECHAVRKYATVRPDSTLSTEQNRIISEDEYYADDDGDDVDDIDDAYPAADDNEEEEEDDDGGEYADGANSAMSEDFDTAEEYAFIEGMDESMSNNESETESDLENRSDESEEDDLTSYQSLTVDSELTALSCHSTLSHIDALKERIRGDDGFELTTSDVAAFYDHPLDEFQRVSVDSYLEGLSIIVCAPTSSGKTLIAESASVISLIRNRRLFYTTPLKALSNQKFRDFRKIYGEDNVGILTGDVSINRDAPIVVMTTEILRNMLYSSIGNNGDDDGGDDVDDILSNVKTIVLDEVHYLSDISRGTVWEETIIYCPEAIQLICLSATISNADEFAHWISQVHGPTELVSSSFRPVPLVWHFSTKYSLKRIFEKDGITLNKKLLKDPREKIYEEIKLEHFFPEKNKTNLAKMNELKNNFLDYGRFSRRKQIPMIQDTLQQLIQNEMLPAIWFIFSRKKCDAALHFLKSMDLLSDSEKGLVEVKIQQFKSQNPDAIREEFLSFLKNGFASHHAGCLPAWKCFVEELFQQGLIKVIFATETLAAGINMPAKTTVISSLSKKQNDYHSLISSNSILQMGGRAGRRGKDKIGHVVIVQNMFDKLEDCYRLLINGSDPLVSQFTSTYGMALNLLSRSSLQEIMEQKLQIESQTESQTDSTETVQQNQPGFKIQTENKTKGQRVKPRKKTMEKAKALIEKSFANYLSNEITFRAKNDLKKIESEIKQLEKECMDFTFDSIFQNMDDGDNIVSEYTEERNMLKNYKNDFQILSSQLQHLQQTRFEKVLENLTHEKNPLLSLNFSFERNGAGTSALYIGKVNLVSAKENQKSKKRKLIFAVEEFSSDSENVFPCWEPPADDSKKINGFHADENRKIGGLHAALTAGNIFCFFSVAEIKNIFSFRENIAGVEAWEEKKTASTLHEELKLFSGKNFEETNGNIFFCRASMKVWPWASILPDQIEDMQRFPEMDPQPYDLQIMENQLAELKSLIFETKKRIKSTAGYKMHRKAMADQKVKEERLNKLYLNEKKINFRLSKMQPAGWKEFINVVNVLKRRHAIDAQTHALTPLGQSALNIRGENELFIASVISNPSLASLKPHQLAAALSSLVSDGIRPRMDSKADGILYNPSPPVLDWLNNTRALVEEFEYVQEEEGVEIPCTFEEDYTGLVEGWAYGLTWKEITTDCTLDEGDLARLLRRTIDLLSQVSHLPDIDPSVNKAARVASSLMDRPPISELLA